MLAPAFSPAAAQANTAQQLPVRYSSADNRRDTVDPKMVDRPRRWDVKFIRNFMIIFDLISSVFDFLTFGLLLLVLRVSEEQFRTGWFIESLFTELFILLVIRTRRTLFRSQPGRWLWLSTLLVGLGMLILPYLPNMQPIFGLVARPPLAMGLLLGITRLYVLANEVAKRIFYRRVSF